MRRLLAMAVLALGLSILTADLAQARIKLITLPVRERVEIQLDNPNATLVEEERIVPLVKGVNKFDIPMTAALAPNFELAVAVMHDSRLPAQAA